MGLNLEMKLNLRVVSLGLLLFAVPICSGLNTIEAWGHIWNTSIKKYDWKNAYMYCVRQNTRLFEPTTKTGTGDQDLLRVNEIMKRHGPFWLGIVNIEDSRKLHGGKTVKFHHWAKNSDWQKFKHHNMWINGMYSNSSGSKCTFAKYGYDGLAETKDCSQKMKALCCSDYTV